MDMAQMDVLFQRAIRSEQEAHRFYAGVIERVDNPTVKDIFRRLAEQEKGHEELLWKMKGDPTLTHKMTAPPDYKVAESVELPELSFDMKPADAIALAMKKEQEAVEFYTGMAQLFDDPEMVSVYQNLANMELGHKHQLEKAFVDIGYPEVW